MMNIKLIAVVALLASAGLYFAQAQSPERPAADPRIDKLIEQNEKILKNQEEMSKTLDTLRQDILQLRRRSS